MLETNTSGFEALVLIQTVFSQFRSQFTTDSNIYFSFKKLKDLNKETTKNKYKMQIYANVVLGLNHYFSNGWSETTEAPKPNPFE